MRIWVKLMALYGMAGEFLAHGLLQGTALGISFSQTCTGEVLIRLWCTTGIPFAVQHPIAFYHVSVHAVFGIGLAFLLLSRTRLAHVLRIE